MFRYYTIYKLIPAERSYIFAKLHSLLFVLLLIPFLYNVHLLLVNLKLWAYF